MVIGEDCVMVDMQLFAMVIVELFANENCFCSLSFPVVSGDRFVLCCHSESVTK